MNVQEMCVSLPPDGRTDDLESKAAEGMTRLELPGVNTSKVQRRILIIKPTRCTNFSNLFLEFNYMFRTVPLSSIGRLSLYTQQWNMSYRLADSLQAGSGRSWFGSVLILLASCQQTCQHIHHCCVYSEKLLMMDRGTVRNM